jgi:hypothetical protein
MEPSVWLELLKIGGPVLLFAVVLLYFTLRDKENMAAEMKADKERVISALIGVTAAVTNNNALMTEIKTVIAKCVNKAA